MIEHYRRRLIETATLAGLLALAACGESGGGVASTPPPAPSPTPAPTPTPTPTPSVNYDTAEYRATVGAVSMNALAAYQHGAIGTGIVAGVIDSGIDQNHDDFLDANGHSRISPASADTAGNASIQDVGGHGTAVAFTLAGGRNGVGSHGVAFDATLLVLRTDQPGSCANLDSKGVPQCQHDDAAIAQALDIATANHARVVNISLGGEAPSSDVTAAMQRATSAGIIIVISAGNDGTANPDPFTAPANDPSVSNGLIIIAGSVNSSDQISSFSDHAGTSAAHYLAAVGESVRAPDQNGTVYLWSGTSFSAPQISGAVALLAQAFPNLTGAQIVSLLLSTARDAGAAGVDPVYGMGVVDLTRAFAPVGSMQVAGSSGVVSTASNAALSTPMGDARQATIGAVVLDGYSRAYAMDLAQAVSHAPPTRALGNTLAARLRNMSADAGGLDVAVSIAPGPSRTLVDRLQLTPADAESARILAASVTARLGSKASFAFGASETGATLVARLAGRADPAFLVARPPDADPGFDAAVGASAALRQRVGSWGVTVAGEHGMVATRSWFALSGPDRYGYDRMTLAFDRRFGALSTVVGASWLEESGTLLGARFTGGLGNARGRSLFVDASARLDAGRWSMGAAWRQGWSFAMLGDGVQGGGLVRSNAFAFDVTRAGLFGGDSLGLRVAQPLRVASGGLDLHLPTDYDYALGITGWTDKRFNLAPQGHELDMELSYGRPLWGGSLDLNGFVRRDPGNRADLPNDSGLALRYAARF